MGIIALIGAFWGDEGKGKVSSYFSQSCDISARFQGGPNAGHSIYLGSEKFVFRVIPAGIVNARMAVIGSGVVINPSMLLDEYDRLVGTNQDFGSHLRISLNAHIITSSHMRQDRGSISRSIETTGMGVGPAIADKVSRIGVRVSDLLTPSSSTAINCEERTQWERFTDVLGPYCVDTSELIRTALDNEKRVVAEGAQGTFLDIDHGDYPFVTSSNTTIGAVLTGLGVGVRDVETVLLVASAYMTKVGKGAFRTRVSGAIAEYLQKKGEEIDGATNKLRDCGWLDLSLLKKSVKLNQANGVVLTKLDVLSGLSQVEVAVGSTDSGSFKSIALHGWEEDISQIRNYDDLPFAAKAYVEYIENTIEVPIIGISVGPYESQFIDRRI